MKYILETERLRLREFELSDAAFTLELVNSPTWLAFIGDKGVRTIKDAEQYLKRGILKSYHQNGYGLWLVELKDDGSPVGMCGLVNRDSLEDIDIGFAMLPQEVRKGYGYESAKATLVYAKDQLAIDRIIAITAPDNIASIRLLNKLGLSFEKELKLPPSDTVLVFVPE